MEIGKTLAILRKLKKLNQSEVARRTDSKQVNISFIERHSRCPDKKTMDKYCEAIGVSETCVLLHSIDTKEIPDQYRYMFTQLKKEIRK